LDSFVPTTGDAPLTTCRRSYSLRHGSISEPLNINRPGPQQPFPGWDRPRLHHFGWKSPRRPIGTLSDGRHKSSSLRPSVWNTRWERSPGPARQARFGHVVADPSPPPAHGPGGGQKCFAGPAKPTASPFCSICQPVQERDPSYPHTPTRSVKKNEFLRDRRIPGPPLFWTVQPTYVNFSRRKPPTHPSSIPIFFPARAHCQTKPPPRPRFWPGLTHAPRF